MPHLSTISNPENRKRFKRACTFFLALGLLLLLISLSFHSSTADHFSIRSSLFALFIIGTLLGSLIALIGTIISAILFIPHVFTSLKQDFPLENLDNEPSLAIDQEDPQPSERYEWYNDVTNPMSPLYQAANRPHHHD